MSISEQDISRLEALAKKAVPKLPWYYRFRISGTCIEGRDSQERVACVYNVMGIGDVDVNARYIEAACNNLPALIARIRELEAQVNQATKETP